MGSNIIDAIKSGLGLAGDLATEFLNAFSTLFWEPATSGTGGSLTVFGTWSLVMLGISVCFACITTVVSLIRSNTGV